MRRQNDNCRFWDLVLDLSCRLKAVDQRHSDIQDDDIWLYSLNLFYCFRSFLSFSVDLKMRVPLYELQRVRQLPCGLSRRFVPMEG